MGTTEKWIQKGRLRTAYRTIASTDTRQKILLTYETLLTENPQQDKMLARHLQNAILPAIAVRSVLPDAGYTKGETLRLIRASVLDSAKPMQRVFRAAGRFPFFFSLLRVMCKKSMPSMFGDGGWQFEWKKDEEDAIEWDCHQCIYHDVFVRYGFVELTAIFCECDDVMYGSIPGIRWGRTKTIGRGANVCDFSFYRD